MLKFSIITPCFNAEKYIAETVESVLTQTAVTSGRIELEYLVCDGGSMDDTVKRVEAFDSPTVQIVSEPDRGMYDALAKGLQRATGDIVAYINAGDYYHKTAFDVVARIFQTKPVQWLTGYHIYYNEDGQVTGATIAYTWRRAFFAAGLYDETRLPMVQQESTFWSRTLHAQLDWERLAAFRYAGDYYLWRQFARAADLKIVQSYLGGFRHHQGQLSEQTEEYQAEMRAMTRPPTARELALAKMDKLIWYGPSTLKKRLNPRGLYRYSNERQDWI